MLCITENRRTLSQVILIILISLILVGIIHGADDKKLTCNGKRLEQRIFELAKIGQSEKGGIDRVAFSEADKKGRDHIQSVLKEAGLSVRMDAASNIIGRLEGSDPNLPVILLGSHIDTVPQGGKYDGALGVLAAIEAVETLVESKTKIRHPIEVLVFTNEEGGLIGSRAMIGKMTPEALNVVSLSGKTVGEGIEYLGGDLNRLQEAILEPSKILSFLELHIEQGATLETEKIDIGVVQGIVGIHWWDVVVDGFANHAGTTPMNNRKDALVAAAQFVLTVNKVALSLPGRHVATVGKIHAEPGAPNVIPGKVKMSLEIRDLSPEKIQMVYQKIFQSTKKIEEDSGCRFTFSGIDAKSISAPMDEQMQQFIYDAAVELGYRVKRMPSGAGHDAQNMAKIVPTGMLFVPSIGGISHSPKEFTRSEDMVKGANVILHTLLKLDRDWLSKK